MPAQEAYFPGLDPIRTGALGRCPRCGKAPLFQGFLAVAPRCRACGLDFGFADSADGPAVFVILIVGFIMAGAALLTEVAYTPPIWVHVVVWGPLVVVLSLGLLRPLKGVLVAVQYANKAQQGEIDRRE